MMNFASFPTDQSSGSVPSTNRTITDILLGAYKNSLAQKDMQKQKSAQDAMQYSQPFGNEQDLMQQQMKILQGYKPPEVQMPQEQSAAQMEENRKNQQQAALSKYLSNDDQSQTDQTTQPTTTQATPPLTAQPVTPGQMPPINNSAPYGQTSPNPMLMDGGQPPGQAPVQAVPAQIPQDQQSIQALQQGMQKPTVQTQPTMQQAPVQAQTQAPVQATTSVPAPQSMMPQQNAPIDYSNIDTLPSSGNPKMDALDKAWLQNPAAVEGQFGLSGSKKTIPNLVNGQMIEQTTLPSGRTMYKPIQVTNPSSGTTVFDPTTGNPIVQMGGGGAEGQIRPKLGEGIFYKTDDEGNTVLDKNTGKPIPQGTLTPYTPDERNEITGRALMSDLQPIVNEAQSNYTGKGSIERFKSDVDYVEKHPDEDSEQKRRLVDFKVSEKLLAPLTTKEQATLGASNTLGSFRALQPSLKSSDLPKFMKVYESFEVPGSVTKEAGEKFLKVLTESTNKANAQVPAFQKRYYNIEDQQADQARALAKAAKNNSSQKVNYADYFGGK